MTEMLKKEFSRKSFVKGGGALIVGFSAVGAGLGAKAAKAAIDPYASGGPFNQIAVDSWIIIHADNTASVKMGKVEMGQGTPTALLMIAAEELDMAFSQMKTITHDTNVTPNQGSSVGSQGVQTGGKQTRAAAAAARTALLKLAATNLGVPVASLTVKDGVVSGGGRTVTYGALLGDKLFNTTITGFSTAGNATTPAQAVAGSPGTKPVGQYKIVGTSPPRMDIPDKVTGKYVYIQNISVPGMLHGRVVRPRGQGAYGDGTNQKILSVDKSSIKSIKGVQVIQFGNFLGVVAPTEYAAIQAAAQLKVTFAEPPVLPGVGNLWKGMRDDDAAGKAPARVTVNNGNFGTAFANRRAQGGPDLQVPLHRSPSHRPVLLRRRRDAAGCSHLHEHPGRLRDPSEHQGRARRRHGLAGSGAQPDPPDLRRGRQRLRLRPVSRQQPGCGDHVGLTGKPVRLQFMRWDEHGWDNYGPAQMTDIRAGASADGKLVALEYTAVRDPLLLDPACAAAGDGGQDGLLEPRDAVPAAGSRRGHDQRAAVHDPELEDHREEPADDLQSYFSVSFLRAPDNPQSAFATEQAVDELAYMAKMDPVAFRLLNIATPTTDVDPRSGGRTCSPPCRRRPTGSRRWLPRASRAPTSSRAAASRSATTRTR